MFGLKSLHSKHILGALAQCFYSDCDTTLFGTAIAEYCIDNNSKVVAAPAKHQSANSLVESHWKTMVHMARVYLTKKQMSHNYWFFAITHAAQMMNAIPGKFRDHLALPFLLVHDVGHDERTWIPLFSLCYFHHEKDSNDTRTKLMAHTMDGVIVQRSPTSNALIVFNPQKGQYYEPDSYRIDSYCLPCLVYPTLKYAGGLLCSLLQDDNLTFEEKYSPGTRIERIDPSTNKLLVGTVMDIPFPVSPSEANSLQSYIILFDNGTTSVPLNEMAGLIPPPPVEVCNLDSHNSPLPSFLLLNSKNHL
jgi:hypothetical protein